MMPEYEAVRSSGVPRHLRDVVFSLPYGVSYHDLALIPHIDAATGIVIAISTLDIDMNERRAALEALQSDENRYRSIAESTAEAFIAADQQGNIISWNRGAEVMFDYAGNEIIGQAATMLMPERYRQVHLEGIARMQMTGRGNIVGHAVEYTGLRKDGTEFPLVISLSTWVVSGVRYYGALISDITDYKRLVGELDAARHAAEQATTREGSLACRARSTHRVAAIAAPRDPTSAKGILLPRFTFRHTRNRRSAATFLISFPFPAGKRVS